FRACGRVGMVSRNTRFRAGQCGPSLLLWAENSAATAFVAGCRKTLGARKALILLGFSDGTAFAEPLARGYAAQLDRGRYWGSRHVSCLWCSLIRDRQPVWPGVAEADAVDGFRSGPAKPVRL